MYTTILPATLYSGSVREIFIVVVLEKYYILKIKSFRLALQKSYKITTSITISFTYINHKLINWVRQNRIKVASVVFMYNDLELYLCA